MKFKNERILLLGASGFLGSELLKHLLPFRELLFCPEHAGCDLMDSYRVKILFDTCSPTIVINCAGKVGGIIENMKRPAEFFYDNLMVGANVIEQSRISHVKKLVQIGTTCSYPKTPPASYHVAMTPSSLWDGYPEETNAPYAIAKRAMIEMSNSYAHQYGFNSVTVILANLYGENCRSSHVIPDIISKIATAKKNGEDVTLFGTGNPTREFLHVSDAAKAIMLAIENYDSPIPLNCGNGEEHSIKSIASILSDIIGFKGNIVWDTSKPDGQSSRLLDSSEIRNLGWKPEISLRSGLEKAVMAYNTQQFDLISR